MRYQKNATYSSRHHGMSLFFNRDQTNYVDYGKTRGTSLQRLPVINDQKPESVGSIIVYQNPNTGNINATWCSGELGDHIINGEFVALRSKDMVVRRAYDGVSHDSHAMAYRSISNFDRTTQNLGDNIKYDATGNRVVFKSDEAYQNIIRQRMKRAEEALDCIDMVILKEGIEPKDGSKIVMRREKPLPEDTLWRERIPELLRESL